MRTVKVAAVLLVTSAVGCAGPTRDGHGEVGLNMNQQTEKPLNLVDVTDCGAITGDGRDDTTAVLAAVAKCRETGADGIRFRPGRYDFHAGSNPGNPRTLLAFHGLRNLTIDGNGAECIFHGDTAAFTFSDCHNLTIRGLVIDYARPPFSIGEIVAAEGDWFEVQVFDEFPVKGGEPVQAFMDYEPDTGLPRDGGLDVYALFDQALKTELTAPQRLRVHAGRKLGVTLGTLAVLRHHVYTYHCFYFGGCSNVRVEDTTVYTCPGMALAAGECENVALERFNVRIKPGTGRLMSAAADATHFGGCKGDLVIRDCLFEGMGDDAVNAKTGLFLTVTERVDERTVLTQHNLKMRSLPAPGEVMELVRQATLIGFGEATVETAEVLDDGVVHRLVFRGPLPENLGPGDLLGNISRTPRVRISNCTVARNRARGFLIQVRDAIVEGCTFRRCTSSGIFIISEAVHFYESIPARNIIVRGNRFEDCNYGAATGPGAISVCAYLKGFEYPTVPGVFRDITVVDNVIDGCVNPGIMIAGGDGIVVRGNTLLNTCRRLTRGDTDGAITVMGSRNVEISGNTVSLESQGDACGASLRLGSGCEQASIQVGGNIGF